MLLPGSNFTEIGTRITTNPANNRIRDFAVNTPNSQVEPSGPTAVAQLTWRLPGVDVKYLGGYDKYQYHQVSDFDGTAVSSYTIPCSAPGCVPVRYLSDSIFNYVEDKAYWSNELNVSSSGSGNFQWIGGLYQYSEDYTQPVYFPNPNPALLTPYNFGGVPAGLAAPNPTSWIYYIDQHMRTDSYAGFGQIDWKLFDSWKVTLGARYTEDKRHGNEYTRQLCYGLTPFFGCADLAVAGQAAVAADATTALINHANPPGTTGIATVDPATGVWSRGLEGEWHATTGTAGVEWSPAADRMFYGKYSRGYKSGGFNAGVIAALPQTNPEYVDAYELGTKITLAQKFQMNVAVFYNDYKGMQIPLSITPLSGPTQTQFFNMDVVTQGVELETVWQITNQFQVLFNYAYLDTAIQSTCDKVSGGVCLVDNNDTQAKDPDANQAGPLVPGSLGNPPSQSQSVHGQNVPQSPKNKASLNANYRFEFEPGSLTLSASDTWKDATYFSIFNRSYNLAPSYYQVDVRATWADTANRYSIVGYIRNATNSRGYDGYNGALVGQSYTIGGPQTVGENISLTPPRVYGLQVQFRVGGTK
jgi:iron complex outermembrane receptor protein